MLIANIFEKFQALPKNWNSYGAEAPNDTSIYWAQKVLDTFNRFNLFPTGVMPSAEGGIGIYFIKNKLYADIECLNTGEILAVMSDSKTEPIVWEIGKEEISKAVVQIYDFISK